MYLHVLKIMQCVCVILTYMIVQDIHVPGCAQLQAQHLSPSLLLT